MCGERGAFLAYLGFVFEFIWLHLVNLRGEYELSRKAVFERCGKNIEKILDWEGKITRRTRKN